MTIRAYSHCVMRILVFVITSSIPSPQLQIKPVYLPHHTIPVQPQAEVHKCLDTWLKQGVIQPSRNLYVSQVVIVRKKTGDIHLCIDFCTLNAMTIRDSLSLLRIEEALQAVKAAVWFTSFDLAQGHFYKWP